MLIVVEDAKKILEWMIESECVFVPVALIAQRCDQLDNSMGTFSLNDKFVATMLHLQDLGCFVNTEGYYDWSYQMSEQTDVLGRL